MENNKDSLFKCPHCGNKVSILKDGLCGTCYRRKRIMKDKYIPFLELSEKEQKEIIKMREYNQKYLEKSKKNKVKTKNKKIKEQKINKNNDIQEKLEKEINQNLLEAYKKLDIDKNDLDIDVINDINSILDIINIILYYDKEKCDLQKSMITKRIDTIDKYIIDVLHNIENAEFDDDKDLLLESKKIQILRRIRRQYKNKEKSLQMSKKFFQCISANTDKLNDIKKELNCFITALDSRYYNPYVEEPKCDKKILGLHKFKCTCKVTSSQTERKILKFNEVVLAKNTDDARNKVIEILREKYGNDVVWTTIYINFVN